MGSEMTYDNKEPDYITYPRSFDSYRWYKPLIVLVLFLIFWFIFKFLKDVVTLIVGRLSGISSDVVTNEILVGSDTYNNFCASGALIVLGTQALILPALFIATKIVKDRPFSSYSSTNDKWDWKKFIRFTLISVVICALPLILSNVIGGGITAPIQFTTAGFILYTILVPIQCISEEYLFRGYVMQTFGSWFKLPLIGFIAQIVIFRLAHDYDLSGTIQVIVVSMCFGIVTYVTHGLEASSAMHMINNMTNLYLDGFCIENSLTYNVVFGTVIVCAINIVYTIIVVYMVRKKSLTTE